MFERNQCLASSLAGALFALLATLVACSGGGNGVSPPPAAQPSNPQSPQQSGVSIPLSASGSFALPSASGISNTFELSGNNAPAGAALTVSVATVSPSTMHGIPAPNPTAFEYLSLTSSADVTFNTFPKITLTLQSTPVSEGQFSAWLYNTAAATWTDLGTVTVSGSVMSFGPQASNVALVHGITYVVVPFTSQPGAVCPTPTPGPTPAVVTLYVATGSLNQVAAYDQNGHPVLTPGGFPGLLAPLGIVYDSFNHFLYVLNLRAVGTGVTPAVNVYDVTGKPRATTGTFSLSGVTTSGRLAFDSVTRRLYVVIQNASLVFSMKVFDESGNAIPTSGTFPGMTNPVGITFDPSNRHLYVVNSTCSRPQCIEGVTVFDEKETAFQRAVRSLASIVRTTSLSIPSPAGFTWQIQTR